MTKRKIIISGGDGFIGQSIITMFSHEFDFIVLKRKGTKIHYSEVQKKAKIFYDISDLKNADLNYSEVTGFLMLGSSRPYSIPQKKIKDIEELETNQAKRIFDFCKQKNIRHVVFASSKSIYGESDHTPYKEDHDPHPDTLYGLNKLLIEKTGQFYSRKSDFLFTALRLAQVIGKGERHQNMPVSIMQKAILNKPIELWKGVETDRRSYVYIKDAADAFIHFLKSEINGVFNIGLQKPYSLDELVQIILQETPSISEIVRISSLSASPRNDVISVEKMKEFGHWTCRWKMPEALRDYWFELYNSKGEFIP